MKTRTAVTAAALGVAGVAIGGRPLLHRAEHALEQSRRAIRQRADVVGLAAYVAAVKRGLPERDVVLGAYRATTGGRESDAA